MRAIRIYILGLIIISGNNTAFAHHVKGGYIRYEYQSGSSTSGQSVYKVTVTVFYGCGIQGPRGSVTLNVLNGSTGSQVSSATISTTTSTTATKGTFSSCITGTPTVCYEIYTYVTNITVANNSSGYILSVTDEYRSDNIINIANSSSTGIAMTASIPGAISGVDYHNNTSPAFAFTDTALICYKDAFVYPFIANDPVDNDSLSYSLGNGLNNSSGSSYPFYTPLTYNSGYSGAMPLGSGVTINPVTGVISGKAPTTTGDYIIAVYVSEWRKGVLISQTKKELQISVYGCTLTAAELQPSYTNCDNFTFAFQNESVATNINSYDWDFGEINHTPHTSAAATPTYTYTDTGTYTLKLKVSNAGGCSDSATAQVRVYPGFVASFKVSGSCYQSPFIFTNTSYTRYGIINSWRWNFGDESTNADSAITANATYQYSTPGNRTATLIIASDKGCTDTAFNPLVANDKPQITLPFSDTLICAGDRLMLSAQSSGAYSWTPDANMTGASTATPAVSPADTTVYTVTVTDKACVGTATVTVNVLDFITVKLSQDTAICAGDSIALQPNSYALSYLWTESGNSTLSSYNTKNPKAAPQQTTTYYVTANLGHCQDHTQETVFVSPYPQVSVSADTSICYKTTAQLYGSTSAAYYTWKPAGSLLNGETLSPVAHPSATTAYILTVRDTFYCPKPVSDTVVVHVIPRVVVNAGNDTTIVYAQPLQLFATTSADTAAFTWLPASYLSEPRVYNPVANFSKTDLSIYTYQVTANTPEGCMGEDSITVYIYKSLPSIFIPSAFTPNGDGLNDIVIPVLAGIKDYRFFNVFNRWGQLVFTTSRQGDGWNGTMKGEPQPAGTYVYEAYGIDYLSKPVFKKGTLVLIR